MFEKENLKAKYTMNALSSDLRLGHSQCHIVLLEGHCLRFMASASPNAQKGTSKQAKT